MCTDYRKFNNRFSLGVFSGILMALFVAILPIRSNAQSTPVTVSVTVMPLYTSSFYDYINTPNKIFVTLMHTQRNAPDLEVYLKVSISGENGINIYSEPGYKPEEPILLEQGKTFILNNENIFRAFNIDHMVIEGTTVAELLNGAGLPEDFYQICIQVFDYYTDEPLSLESPMGCSNVFGISNLEPPMITNPVCGEEVLPNPLQIVQINWTIPAGSVPGTQYKFELVEIPEYSTLNPNEAFETSGYPPLYEEETTMNTLMLTVQKVVLTQGYTYAFRVRAEYPGGEANYRNDGYSEVCSFTYGSKPSIENMEDKSVQFISPKDNNIDSVLVAADPDGLYFSWRILPFDTETYQDPLKNLPGYQFCVDVFKNEADVSPIFSATTDRTFYQADPVSENLPLVSGQPYWVQVSIEDMISKERILISERCGFRYVYAALSGSGLTSKTITGTLQYSFENHGAASYKLANTEVRLKCLYLLADPNSGKEFEVPESVVEDNLNQNSSFPPNLTIAPIASTVTSTNGSFSFHYSWPTNAPLGEIDTSFTYQSNKLGSITGRLERALRLEVVSPYYSIPQRVIVSNSDAFDMGEVITFVKSYDLKANLFKGFKQKEGLEEELVDKTVFIFRKQKLPGIPVYEGNCLGQQYMVYIPAIQQAGYYLVAAEKSVASTTDDGKPCAKVNFTRLIENLVNGDEYYWYVEGYGLASAQPLRFSNDFSANLGVVGRTTANNVSSTSTTSSQIYQFIGSGQSSGSSYSAQVNADFGTQSGGMYATPIETASLETSDVKITSTGFNSFDVDATLKVLTNEPPMSGIRGRLVYEFPNKAGDAHPLSNRSVSVISCLVTDEPGMESKIVKNNHYEENESAFPYVQVLATSNTDASGNFNFQFPNIDPQQPDPESGVFEVSTGKLNRENSWISWESDPETGFRILYEEKQVNVKRALRLVVNDPTGLFMSPDENLEIEPLETVDVGTLISDVMSYRLKGGVGWYKPQQSAGGVTTSGSGTSTDPYSTSAYFGVPEFTMIQGVDCYVIREKADIENYQLPPNEGQNIVGTLEAYPDFKIIGKTTSDTQGQFVFDNLLLRNAIAPIYLYFETKEMLGDANFEPLRVDQSCINPFIKPLFLFNADYDYSQIADLASTLVPKTATLKGKVTSNVAAGLGVRGALVKLTFSFENGTTTRACQTDSAGYYDFSPVFNQFEDQGRLKLLNNIKIEVSKSGFHYMDGNEHKPKYVNTFDRSNFKSGKQKIVDVPLYGDGSIKGRIVNEQSKPIDAYVQFLENRSYGSVGGEGTMEETNPSGTLFSMLTKGKFEIPAIPGSNRKLVIIPKDVAYFSDTLTLDVSANGVTNVGDIVLYERSHRIAFYVKENVLQPNGLVLAKPIPQARVSLVGSPSPVTAVANSYGRVLLSFNNVSESNLSVNVSGPSGSNYVPKIMSFTNYESDQIVNLPTVYLEKGLVLKGKVLLDKVPTANAEVFVELSKGLETNVEIDATSQGENATTESQYLFKAYPHSDGTFEINTIPPELNGRSITVKAVYRKTSAKDIGNAGNSASNNNHGSSSSSHSTSNDDDENGTISGDEKTVIVPDVSGNFTLNLRTFDAMHIDGIWGFPLEITKIQTQQNSNNVYVSGRINLEGYSPGFDPLEPLVLEVDNVSFAPSSEMLNGVPIGEPVQNEVVVSLKRDFKLKYAKAFNVKLRAPNNALFTIKKDASSGMGKLYATVAIVDNSFQYPSSYLNFEGTAFNFCSPVTSGQLTGILSPVIPVFNSSLKGNGNENVKFNLCNLTGNGLASNLHFKFINFATTATPSGSAIEGDQITLNATLNAKMKDAGDVKVYIEKLVLKNKEIAPISGSTPLMIELKDGGIYDADKVWKIEAQNWRVDPKEGGVVSENCILHTGSIDIPYSYFNLRSDFAYLSDPNTDDINIGGFPIDFTPKAWASTGYNPSCGGDKKGHWQVIFYPPPNGDTPARVWGLPNMNNAPLELETVSLLSNGESVFTIGTGADKMRLYKTVDFKPQSVFSLSDGFVLSGAADFKIPRVRDGVGVRLVFVKGASSVDSPTFDPIDLNFDGKGNIKFNVAENGQYFNRNDRTFTTYGFVQEPGVLAPISVKLTYFDNDTRNLIRTEIVESPLAPKQKVKIGAQNTSLEKITCRTTANQNDWDLFEFEGDLLGMNGISPNSNKRLKFTVHGEIEGNMDGFRGEGVDQSLDGIQMNYQNGRIVGTVTMDNVPLGSARVSGVANLLMDSDGWAFYSNCKAMGVQAPETCNLYMGMLIGDYPKLLPEMSNTVLAYAIKKEMPQSFNDGVHGFYMIGGRELPISGLDVGIDVVVASAHVSVPQAGMDVAFYGNVDDGDLNLGLGITGGLRINFGLGSITCTDLYGYGSASANVTGTYADKSFKLEGGADFEADLKIEQGVPVPINDCAKAISISKTITGGFTFSSDPFKAHFSIDL